MLLVVALKADGDLQHVRLQQAALGADLVRGDGFVLEAERDIQRVDVGGHGGGAGAPQSDAAADAGQQGQGGAGQRQAGAAHEQPAPIDRDVGFGQQHSFRHDGLSPPNGCDGHAPPNEMVRRWERIGADTQRPLSDPTASHTERGPIRMPGHGLVMQRRRSGAVARRAQARQRTPPADLTGATALIHDARDDGPRNRGEIGNAVRPTSSAKPAAAPATVGG